MLAVSKRFNTANWASLSAFLLMLLFVGSADGLMDALGPSGFLSVGVPVMGLAWALVEAGE